MKYVGKVQSQANAEVYATASGTLPNGKPVIVNSDGTVSLVAGTGSAASVGSKATFESAAISFVTSTFDSNSNKLVIVYRDSGNSNYGTAVVGTVSGASISFGTPVVFLSVYTSFISISFDSTANKVVIAYQQSSSPFHGKCRVGTVSGTGISFGTEVTFNSNFTTTVSVCYDSNSNKTVVAYSNKGGASGRGEARVGTISGTNISFGSVAVFESGNIQDQRSGGMAFDSNSNKVVISYSGASPYYGTAVVGTISGTNISFGTAVVFNAASTGVFLQSICFDTNSNKIVIGYNEANAAGKAIVGTVSGTGISFGTAVLFQPLDSARITSISLSFDSSTNIVLISYIDTNTYGANTDHGVAVSGTVSGTSISISNPLVFNSTNTGNANAFASSFDSNANKVVISFRDGPDVSNSLYGKSVVFQPGNLVANLTAENFVGITNGVVVHDAIAEALGSETVFGNNPGGPAYPYMGMAFDLNANRVVIAYRDLGNDSKGTVIVGAISGTSISFGTPVVLLDTGSGGQADYLTVVYDSNSNKVVISFSAYFAASGSSGRACVGTVNPADNSISIGTLATFTSGNSSTTDATATFDSNSNKVVIAYGNSANSGYGTAVVGTVSGTNISFGTAVVFESASANNISSAFDSNSNKVVIGYKDVGNSNYGTSIVGTVSGTGISFGTAVVFNSGRADENAVVFDSNSNKIVIAFMDGGDNEKGKAVVGTVSGTGISYGSEVTFSASGSRVEWCSAVYNSKAQKVIISYRRYIDSSAAQSGELISGTVSGTSISFGTATQFNNAGSNYIGSAYDSTSSAVVTAYSDAGNSNKNTAIVYQAGFDNTVRGSTASGSTAIIQAGGAISTLQTGLTAGQQYFVQTDGTLGLTAASPSVIAGTAVSATDLIVKG